MGWNVFSFKLQVTAKVIRVSTVMNGPAIAEQTSKRVQSSKAFATQPTAALPYIVLLQNSR